MLNDVSLLIVDDKAIKLPQGFTIKVVNTARQSDETFMREVGQLRYRVWSEEGMDMSNSTGAECMLDAVDDNAIIWGVYHDGVIVGSARLNLYDDLADSPTAYMHSELNALCPTPVATLTRLVLLKAFCGNGIGKFFDFIRLEQARKIGAQTALLMCPPWRVEPLQRLGYQHLGKASPSKLWPDADWMIMTLDLSADDELPVFCRRGSSEASRHESLPISTLLLQNIP
jgi:hypothetical protein